MSGLQPGYTSISGSWVLDLNNSETMEGYLRCLCTTEEAIRQQVQREQDSQTRNAIALNGSTLIIHKQTTTNTFTESFVLDEERITQTQYGMRTSVVTLGDSGGPDEFTKTSAFTSSGGDAVVIEKRRLVGDGHVHFQEIRLQNLTTGGQSITRRYWMRVPMTDNDMGQLIAG